MAIILPIVRHLIPCEDYFIHAAHPEKISLINLIFGIRSLQDPPFPVVQREFCLFLMLSNGRGKGNLRLAIVQVDTDEAILKTAVRPINFGNDPLRVIGLPIRIKDCEFPAAGLYSIEVTFDDQLIGQQQLLLK